MSRFLRSYTIASLVCALGAVVLFVLMFRVVMVQAIIELAQQNNVTYGKNALRQIDAALVDYLESAATLTADEARRAALPRVLDVAIADLMQDRGIARVKIYNRRGMVVFSTRRAQIGDDQSANDGFLEAMRGNVKATLIYRDTFNRFDRDTEENNLVATYIPIPSRPTEPIRGVLELYTDVNALTREAELAEYRILAAGALILPVLWAMLLLFVRRATQLIESQQAIIRERNATLAALSAHMLQTEEAERKRLAHELHEDLAQTLTAIKLALETASGNSANAGPIGHEAIALLQETIGRVRSLAIELRPPSLDDLGLLPAISALCRDFGRLHTNLAIELRHKTTESAIPIPMKIVIYRCLEIALNSTLALGQVVKLEAGVDASAETIGIVVGFDARATLGDAPDEATMALAFEPLRARVLLTGGEVIVRRDARGWTMVRASWPR